jgi:hypothetical protein
MAFTEGAAASQGSIAMEGPRCRNRDDGEPTLEAGTDLIRSLQDFECIPQMRSHQKAS